MIEVDKSENGCEVCGGETSCDCSVSDCDWNVEEMNFRSHFLLAVGGGMALIQKEGYKIRAVDIQDVAPPCEGCEDECAICDSLPITYVVMIIYDDDRPDGITFLSAHMFMAYIEESCERASEDDSGVCKALRAQVSVEVSDKETKRVDKEADFTATEAKCVALMKAAIDEHFLKGPEDVCDCGDYNCSGCDCECGES